MKKDITIGEKYSPAMEITDQKEAMDYLEKCIKHTMRYGNTYKEALSIEKQNLGYYAGYYDNETRIRVERLFSCSHPMFGEAIDGTPTSEEAFNIGKVMASKS